MQLTLRQAQIDEALSDYVHKTISVKEGFEVQSTLKATRGEEGATAFVSIVPVGTERAVKTKLPKNPRTEPVVQTKPRLGVAQAVQKAQEAITKPLVNPAEVKVVNDAPGNPTETVVEADPADVEVSETVAVADPVVDAQADVVTDAQPEVEPVADAEPAPVPEKKPSLFANLKKPVNS